MASLAANRRYWFGGPEGSVFTFLLVYRPMEFVMTDRREVYRGGAAIKRQTEMRLVDIVEIRADGSAEPRKTVPANIGAEPLLDRFHPIRT